MWWTLRRPHRPLTYHAAHRMFERANVCLGSDWTLHDLRGHSAATRMARDPQMTRCHPADAGLRPAVAEREYI